MLQNSLISISDFKKMQCSIMLKIFGLGFRNYRNFCNSDHGRIETAPKIVAAVAF